MKRILAASASAVIAMTGTALTATPAEAAPVLTGGLVNVTVTDVAVLNDVDVLRNSRILNNLLNGNDVNVGVGVAANILAQVCGVDVALLAALRDGESVTCAATNQAGDLILTQTN